MRSKRADQRITFQVIGAEHVPHTSFAIVGGPKTIHMADSGVMPAVSGQKVQRTELVDTDSSAADGSLGIQTSNTPVFRPELRVGGIFPRLGMPPVDLAFSQKLPEPFKRYRRNDLLFAKVLSQLFKRPDAQADQLLRRRQGHFADLFE